uniref:NADH dehydrogenase subunit 6 n=1 Tax=Kleidocerys resedae resedae TaxID=1503485 RepID=A0A060BD78_9HEMI|nr:NADH dehydrogenase subunit 6 [Kleidocerys resedae resedae]
MNMTMAMMLSIMFMLSNHPMMMSLIIIMQTINISMMTGMSLGSFWFSYIIMIIMLSGMLVLLIYMASIASNEKIIITTKQMITILLMFIINNKIEQNEIPSIKNMNLMLNNMFNSTTNTMIIMMVFYLLMTMIIISKIVNIHEGPLRIKN